ncbi:hypothetical protein HXX76_011561 [Chlamydomonas incerta]|uniref:Protein kinase domain-containing protein n=1 Tax=Chlamydomonas incerta TaxID=51695 RepID=A0A835VX83_CHLIN|nr:hypothetical protein HXX76_011561 [Chlamydomonas incerta]|eukprot:KAG2428441.1 hypothetical protein HXX76_011561 [Chlamydomonas incerta]
MPSQHLATASEAWTEERYWEDCSDRDDLVLRQEAGSFSASCGAAAAAAGLPEAQQPAQAWGSSVRAAGAGDGGPTSSMTNISEVLTALPLEPAAMGSSGAEDPLACVAAGSGAGDCLSGPLPAAGPRPVPRDLPAPLPRQRRAGQAPCEAANVDVSGLLAIRTGGSPLQADQLLTLADLDLRTAAVQQAGCEEPQGPPSPAQQAWPRPAFHHSAAPLSPADQALRQGLSPLHGVPWGVATRESPAAANEARLDPLGAGGSGAGARSSIDGAQDFLRAADSPFLPAEGAATALFGPLQRMEPRSCVKRTSDGGWAVHASAQSATQPCVRGFSGSGKPVQQYQAGGRASWLRPPLPQQPTVGGAAVTPPRSCRSSCTELAAAAAARLPAPPAAALLHRPEAPRPPLPPHGAASPQVQEPTQQLTVAHGGLLRPRLPWLASLSAEDAARSSGSGSCADGDGDGVASAALATNSVPLPRLSACAGRPDSPQCGNSGPLRLLLRRTNSPAPTPASGGADAAPGPDALSAADGLLFVSTVAPAELLQPPAAVQQQQGGPGGDQSLPPPREQQLWCMARFKVVRKLYEGYASRVFRATCTHSGAEVALKVYDTSGLNTFLRHQVLRELDIHARLTHTSIVQLYAAFKEGDILVMVQEYVRGGSLDRVRRKLGGRMTEFQSMHLVLLPLLNALVYLHGRGIVHRDIKPENLLFTPEWQLKLCDFGVSICLHEERAVTKTGSQEYMAPEVLVCPLKCGPEDNKDNEQMAYTPAVDVWSLGALMYELLVGFTPFPGGPPARTGAEPAPPLRFPSSVSEPARAFVQTCLQLHPGDRPTVQELLQHEWVVTSLVEAAAADAAGLLD